MDYKLWIMESRACPALLDEGICANNIKDKRLTKRAGLAREKSPCVPSDVTSEGMKGGFHFSLFNYFVRVSE